MVDMPLRTEDAAVDMLFGNLILYILKRICVGVSATLQYVQLTDLLPEQHKPHMQL